MTTKFNSHGPDDGAIWDGAKGGCCCLPPPTLEHKMSLPLLSDCLPQVLNNPLMVSCYQCRMTMWANSENALLDPQDRIICRSCANELEEQQETRE